MRVQGINMARFVDGEVAEGWEEGDMLGVLRSEWEKPPLPGDLDLVAVR